MKKWFILIGVIAIFLIGGYFVLSFYAVKFIQAQLQKVVDPGLTIGEIKIKPTYLSVKGIRYEDPLSKRRVFLIEEMRVYPDLSSFLKGTLRIREWMILQPSFFLYRSREGRFIGPWATLGKKEKGKEISDERERKGKESILVKIDLFRIRKGSVDFEDMKPEGASSRNPLERVGFGIKKCSISLHFISFFY